MLATTVSDGVEQLCQCGFKPENLNEIILKCFTDNLEKINVLLLLTATPNTNISEILGVMRTWIEGSPKIPLNGSDTKLSIDSTCDIETIQDSRCNNNPSMEAECIDGGVRLMDGQTTTEGRVEVCLGGQWGTICTHQWTQENTDVVCGQLGFLSAGTEYGTFHNCCTFTHKFAMIEEPFTYRYYKQFIWIWATSNFTGQCELSRSGVNHTGLSA